jgi:hypothetical protein
MRVLRVLVNIWYGNDGHFLKSRKGSLAGLEWLVLFVLFVFCVNLQVVVFFWVTWGLRSLKSFKSIINAVRTGNIDQGSNWYSPLCWLCFCFHSRCICCENGTVLNVSEMKCDAGLVRRIYTYKVDDKTYRKEAHRGWRRGSSCTSENPERIRSTGWWRNVLDTPAAGEHFPRRRSVAIRHWPPTLGSSSSWHKKWPGVLTQAVGTSRRK